MMMTTVQRQKISMMRARMKKEMRREGSTMTIGFSKGRRDDVLTVVIV
jgi:hypothetical protein